MRRITLFIAAMVPLLGFIGLLGWGMVKSGGGPAGVAVNSELGEVSVRVRPAPEFTLDTFDGETLGLSDLRGKVVMVDFWASWCPPCRQEAPILAKVSKEYQQRGVEFVGISIWDAEGDAKAYVQRYGIAYPNGIDAQGRTAVDYGVTGIPEKYLVSPEGVMQRKFIGPMSEGKLKQVLDETLANSQ